jgi:hypothetical protein
MMGINLFIAGDVPMDPVVLTGMEIKVAIGSCAERAAWQRNHQANKSILEKIAIGALPANHNVPKDQRRKLLALDFEVKGRADIDQMGIVGASQEVGIFIPISFHPETASIHGKMLKGVRPGLNRLRS